MEIELNRVETTAIALNVGIAYEWSANHVMANGLSAQKNPLGAALTHLLAHPNGTNARLVTNLLAVQLVKEKRCTDKESWDTADMALTYWFDSKCPECKGTGVKNIEQDQCPKCSGTGRQPEPRADKVKQAISVIEFHLEWLENQLTHRLTGRGLT